MEGLPRSERLPVRKQSVGKLRAACAFCKAWYGSELDDLCSQLLAYLPTQQLQRVQQLHSPCTVEPGSQLHCNGQSRRSLTAVSPVKFLETSQLHNKLSSGNA